MFSLDRPLCSASLPLFSFSVLSFPLHGDFKICSSFFSLKAQTQLCLLLENHTELRKVNFFILRLLSFLFQAEMKSFQEEISSEVKAVLERTQYEIRDVSSFRLDNSSE